MTSRLPAIYMRPATLRAPQTPVAYDRMYVAVQAPTHYNPKWRVWVRDDTHGGHRAHYLVDVDTEEETRAAVEDGLVRCLPIVWW